ncbi:MAG: hypothetical protein HN392_04360 [Anaerolineae bacterium]|nr:hypothetical protein [Anaerolineae bacterium]
MQNLKHPHGENRIKPTATLMLTKGTQVAIKDEPRLFIPEYFYLGNPKAFI